MESEFTRKIWFLLKCRKNMLTAVFGENWLHEHSLKGANPGLLAIIEVHIAHNAMIANLIEWVQKSHLASLFFVARRQATETHLVARVRILTRRDGTNENQVRRKKIEPHIMNFIRGWDDRWKLFLMLKGEHFKGLKWPRQAQSQARYQRFSRSQLAFRSALGEVSASTERPWGLLLLPRFLSCWSVPWSPLLVWTSRSNKQGLGGFFFFFGWRGPHLGAAN